MTRFAVTVCMFGLLTQAAWSAASPDQPLLLRKPALSRTHIAFSFGGDIWIVPREGGEATRLTAGAGLETDPAFSPDGTQIAFTGEYDGNVDVFVVPISGGTPRRLTWHPGDDRVIGWTPDGKQVVFSSSRNSYTNFRRLFTMPIDGSFPTELPLSRADEGSFASDGRHIAYVPITQWQAAWKRYRGGQTKPIWIADLNDSNVVKVPRDNSNDFNPMWIGNMVYFLSDRDGPVTLYGYDTETKRVTRVLKNDGLDVKSASAGLGAIVYEQFGAIHLYELKARREHPVRIELAGDFPAVRAHFGKIEPHQIRGAAISPTGARAVFAARGEIFTVPAEKGDIRNLTNTVAVNERDPAWSRDGKSIAYFSDASGEYELEIRDQSSLGEPRRFHLGDPPSFYYSPRWSPDNKKIAYTDKRLNVCYIDLEKRTPVHIDADTYAGPSNGLNPSWSPDSRWISYTKQLPSHLHAVFAYSIEQNKSFQITDGMSDALHASFDPGGKYLYFTASTDTALSSGWLDMSSMQRPATRSVYVAVLAKDLPSPLAPESDEEKAAAKEDKEKPEDKKKDDAPTVRIDFENISQRVLALPIPARNYLTMEAGKAGVLYLLEAPFMNPLGGAPGDGPSLTLHMFDLKTRKTDKIREGIGGFEISANGEKMLYRQGPQWFIVPAGKQPATPPPADSGAGGPLKLDTMQAYVDPRAEWKHMYHQVWRDERDFFYDPGLHGLSLAASEKKYEPYLEHIVSRNDLNYLFEEMLGDMTVGHMFIGGGDRPELKRVKGGLLGADYSVENGRYRFTRIYNGENWNPQLKAPLTQPGVNVVVGEYLLAVQGRELRSPDNVYSYFEETAGKSITLRVGSDPGGANSREVTVVPIENETGLRNLAWIEDNRRKVDQMTGGRVAYVYLPNTGGGGYTNFNRYYFGQAGKEAAIIDERFNGGGSIADYIIDYLRRPLLARFSMREGTDITTPIEGIFGPKVMIINEMAGSGGDAMPWMFRKAGIGPLIGTRTWGGLVGHYTGPGDLIDGGNVGTPNLAFYNLDGSWDVENHGVQPDIEVEMDAKLVRQGHDPQLEKAVEVVMDLLKKNPVRMGTRPSYPNYHQR